MKNIIFILIICFAPALESASPSEKQLALTSITKMNNLLSIRKIAIPDTPFLEEIIQKEEAGFIGYQGNSIEFMIYQDIIRLVIELIVEIPIRNDFHFLAAPLDPLLWIQTKEQLAEVFKGSSHPEIILYDTTFPLNFTLYDNVDRLGLSTIENFIKNQSVKPLGYRKRLVWFFNNLGIDEDKIDDLFNAAHSKLSSKNGIILQLLDDIDYSFSKKIAYPAYSNGYISANVTIDEYLNNEDFVPPYPHEIRLLLTNKETLNPNSPIKIMRYFPEEIQSKLSSYERLIRKKIKNLSFNSSNRSDYRNELLAAWE